MSAPVYDTISDRDRAMAHVLKFFSMTRTPDQKGICLTRDGKVIAAAVYDQFNGTNIWMHGAGTPGRRWLTRDFLKWMFHYPFCQLKCARISLWVDANNADSIRFVTHLGFRKEAVLAGAGQGGADVFIYVMTRQECRYV